MASRVLVVDDDAELRAVLKEALREAGFDVVTARDGFEAMRIARGDVPDLVLLDVLMPFISGDDVYRALRQEQATRYIPVIFLTAQGATKDKAQRLFDGADDYVTKPFEMSELVARVATALRRSAELRALNPLSGLPGNIAISRELARALEIGGAACLYCDLDSFKAFNDHYGFARGDDLIKLLGRILVSAAEDIRGDTFVGHVGGDDFVLVVPEADAEDAARAIVRRFDAEVSQTYDAVDRERGYVVRTDRRGAELQVPFVSVSIGIVPVAIARFADAVSVSRAAAEVKEIAKSREGSSWALDRRQAAEPSLSSTTG